MFLTYCAFVSRLWLLPENHLHLVRSLTWCFTFSILTFWVDNVRYVWRLGFFASASTFKRCGTPEAVPVSELCGFTRHELLSYNGVSDYYQCWPWARNRELGCECGFRGLGICMFVLMECRFSGKLEAGSLVFIIHKILHSEWFGHPEMSDQCNKACNGL